MKNVVKEEGIGKGMPAKEDLGDSKGTNAGADTGIERRAKLETLHFSYKCRIEIMYPLHAAKMRMCNCTLGLLFFL